MAQQERSDYLTMLWFWLHFVAFGFYGCPLALLLVSAFAILKDGSGTWCMFSGITLIGVILDLLRLAVMPPEAVLVEKSKRNRKRKSKPKRKNDWRQT